MHDFKQLVCWQRAHELTLQVYRLVQVFPAVERYGLVSQLTRAASAIGANIAEGCGRGTDRDLKRFLQIAFGSAYEVENHLLLAKGLGLIDDAGYLELENKVHEVQRLVAALIRKIRVDLQNTTDPR